MSRQVQIQQKKILRGQKHDYIINNLRSQISLLYQQKSTKCPRFSFVDISSVFFNVTRKTQCLNSTSKIYFEKNPDPISSLPLM